MLSEHQRKAVIAQMNATLRILSRAGSLSQIAFAETADQFESLCLVIEQHFLGDKRLPHHVAVRVALVAQENTILHERRIALALLIVRT